ncbi:DUF1345 domain-containing protein [Brevibacterium sp. 'Marine']|uniref:DUF1345 domain-containing protein n=1 Tax=Brevibacterium sp. 'Marine' TaxID=2725563 RepID=UPI002006DC2F|nr:DUF1345 domain-containing protein [Brevibacterium sp. 'Marine']
MRPTHSQMITLSDDMRANIAGVPALVVSLVVVFGLDFSPLGSGAWAKGSAAVSPALTGEFITVFLVFWPLFALTYLMWTHVGLNDLDETELIVHARWTLANRRRWWSRWFGMGGAVSWATMAAYVAFIFNIFLVTSGAEDSPVISAVLGLANVIASWAVLVYSFALEFMRLDLSGGGSPDARQLEFDMDAPREFGDYLTFSVLSSTMTAALPGRAVSRMAWRTVRANVIVAFAFNSVVVATLVSMILSYVM